MTSMIMWGAIIGGCIGGGSSILNVGKSNRKMKNAFKKQMRYAMRNYNYNQAALDREERGVYDEAMQEMFTIEMNALQNNAMIEAGLSETGTEGRNSDKIEQVTEATTGRQATSIKEAAEASVWQTRSAKDALYVQTAAEFEQARDRLSGDLIGGMRAVGMVVQGAAQGAAIGALTAGIGSAAGSAMSSTAATPAAEGALSLTSVETLGATGAETSSTLGAAGATSTAGGALSLTSVETLGATTAEGAGANSTMLAAGSTAALSTSNAGLTGASNYFAMATNGSSLSTGASKFMVELAKKKPMIEFYQSLGNYGYQVGSIFNPPQQRRGWY